MAEMKRKHGAEKGERIFYATAHKRKKAKKGRGSVLHGDR